MADHSYNGSIQVVAVVAKLVPFCLVPLADRNI